MSDKKYDGVHGYKSSTYASIVLMDSSIDGWRCEYAGCGSMLMKNIDGRELSIREKEVMSDNWMECCWNQFLTLADIK